MSAWDSCSSSRAASSRLQVLPIGPELLAASRSTPRDDVAVLLGQDDVVGVGHPQDADDGHRPLHVEPDGEVADLVPGPRHPGVDGWSPGSARWVTASWDQGDLLLGVGQLPGRPVGPLLGRLQVVLGGGRAPALGSTAAAPERDRSTATFPGTPLARPPSTSTGPAISGSAP